MEEITKQERFENIPIILDRLSPYIITEIDLAENRKMFEAILPRLEPYVVLDNITSPVGLFNFLKEHKTDTIIVNDDIFFKRINYWGIMEGAVCSTLEGGLWPVRFNLQEFEFTGKIILCTSKTKHDIISKKRFEHFKRDCLFI